MKTKVNVMKKVLGFVLTLVMVCSMLPMTSNAAEGTTKFYLNPGGSSLWDQADAWFAAWCWGGSKDAAWVTGIKTAEGCYEFDNSAGYTGCKIFRFGPSIQTPTFDAQWNDSGDLAIPTSDCIMYNITGWGTGAWGCGSSKSNGVCDLCDTWLDGMSALAGHSLSVDGKIGVNFHMELTDAVVAKKDTAYVQFTLENGATSQVKVADAIVDTESVQGKTYYVFTCEVAAKEMTDTIKAQIVCDENKGTEYTYTVRAYADELLAKSSNEAEQTFVKRMLNYGAASQTYFEYKTEKLANEGIGLEVGTYTAEALETAGFKANVTGDDSILTNRKVNLVLESETTLNVKFTADAGTTVKLNGEGVDVTGTDYTISIANLNASQLDNVQTIVVTVDDKEATITCSALSYCHSVLANSNKDSLKNVACTLYDYNKAAIAYIGNN